MGVFEYFKASVSLPRPSCLMTSEARKIMSIYIAVYVEIKEYVYTQTDTFDSFTTLVKISGSFAITSIINK